MLGDSQDAAVGDGDGVAPVCVVNADVTDGPVGSGGVPAGTDADKMSDDGGDANAPGAGAEAGGVVSAGAGAGAGTAGSGGGRGGRGGAAGRKKRRRVGGDAAAVEAAGDGSWEALLEYVTQLYCNCMGFG